MSKDSNLYYKESGIVPRSAVVRVLIVSFITTFVVGILYSFLSHILIVYLDFLLTFLYAGTVGFGVGIVSNFWKIRNDKWVRILGFIAGVHAVFFSWVFTIYIWTDELLLFNPARLVYEVLLYGHQGTWSILDYRPHGFLLYIVWAIEAIILMSTTSIVASAAYGNTPFCEDCNTWTEGHKIKEDLVYPKSNPEQLQRVLEVKDFSYLLGLHHCDPNAPRRLNIRLCNCKTCNKSNYLDIKLKTAMALGGENNEMLIKSSILIDHMHLSQDEYKALSDWEHSIKPDDSPDIEESSGGGWGER